MNLYVCDVFTYVVVQACITRWVLGPFLQEKKWLAYHPLKASAIPPHGSIPSAGLNSPLYSRALLVNPQPYDA